MKRIIKRLFLFSLFVLSLIIIYPTNVDALLEQASYININDNTKSLIVDYLSFTNISFKDYSSTSTLNFGLTGTVTNNYSEPIFYISSVYYYDENYNLIAQSYNSNTAIVGTSDFNQMSNLSILNGHSINEIYYYSLKITTTSGTSTDSNTPSKNSQYNSRSYVIDEYDVNIIVNENNTLDITETITAYFKTSKHGIFRTIPLRNTVRRLDGTTSKNRVQITNLSVNSVYITYKEKGNYIIKIGSVNRALTGKHTYVIKYTYNLGKDPVKNYDELYYNIIGDGWDTVIGNVTFTITMPKKFDSSKLGFSSGKKGSTNNKNIEYNVNENTITGKYNGILGVGEALTVRCELEEGYFVGAGLPINTIECILFFIPVVFLGVAALIWYKFGRDEPVIETVEFYPPKGLNSLEVGLLYKGEADSKDVTSLLIYLANKGYIKINETEKKILFFKTKDFKITKLKKYNGNNTNERMFLNGLFKDKTNEVTSHDLYDNFYITMEKILSRINDPKNKDKIFEKNLISKSKIIILMITIAYCLITIPPVFAYDSANMFYAILVPGIGFYIILSILFGGTPNNKDGTTRLSLGAKICVLIGSGLFCTPWVIVVLPILLQDSIYLIGYIIGLICILGMIIFLKYLPKRTQYGNKMLGKLRSFKNFLETAEKEKLEAMVTQDPTYFYNILPYTYVLGISDKWIKKFETISLKAPQWYECSNAFDFSHFESFMNNTMSSARSNMSANPSRTGSSSGGGYSGGSFSGGGSSGGGSGGGGGGSW